jgi:hypothetical protein
MKNDENDLMYTVATGYVEPPSASPESADSGTQSNALIVEVPPATVSPSSVPPRPFGVIELK